MGDGGLSAAQESILVEQMLEPGSSNITATIWRLRGMLDVDRLLLAIRHTFEQTPALHVRFETDDAGAPRAVPMTPVGVSPTFHDVSGTGIGTADARARQMILGLCSTPFDLAKGRLFRVAVVRVAPDDHVLALVLHHVLTDAYGVFDVLSQGIADAYHGDRQATPTGPTASPVAPGLREDAYRRSPFFAEDADFWRGYLDEAAPGARLPEHGVGTPASPDGWWDTLGAPLGVSSSTVVIPRADIADPLAASGAPGEVSFPDLVMASIVGFISRVSDSRPFTFSFTVNFRQGVHRKAPGLYSNSVPLSVSPSPTGSTTDLARSLSADRLDVLQHAEYNVALMKRVARRTGETRSPFGPVVNVMPFLQELDLGTAVGTLAGGLFGVPDEAMISVFTDGSPSSDLFVRLDAPTALYSAAEVRTLGGLLARYLTDALRSPDTAIGSLALMPSSEGTLGGPFADDEILVDIDELLADRAAVSPGSVAVSDRESSLSNDDVLEQARSVRRLLTRAGVATGDVVALAVPPCLALIPVHLGLAMSGAATAPLAPGASLDSSSDADAARLPGWLVSLAGLDEVVVTPLADGVPVWSSSLTSVDVPDTVATSTAARDAKAPGYVASGVSLSHAGLQALVRRTAEVVGIGPDDTVAVRTNGWESLCAVLAGASIAILPRPSQRDAVTVAFLAQGDVTEWLPVNGALEGMRAIVHGGEPLPASTRRAWNAAKGGRLYAALAPSPELPPFAVTSLDDSDTDDVLAGRVDVLDRRLGPVGHGLVGRLHTIVPTTWASSREGIALRGSRAMSAFALPVLAGIEHERLRVWGDARRAATSVAGTLLLATLDRSVEAIVGVAEAASRVVSAEESTSSQPRLTLYVVPAAGGLLGGAEGSMSFDAGLDMAAVRTHAGALVAGLATIGDVIVVDTIPRTADGLPRVDELPATTPGDSRVGAVTTQQEERVAELFRQVLGRSEVGARDDFFQLGGDSITALRLASLARRTGLTLAVRDVFAYRTVGLLAERVTKPEAGRRSRGSHAASPSRYPLPPVAHVFDRGDAFDRFAQWMALTSPSGLDRAQLTVVLQRLIDRHDALRSRRTDTGMSVSRSGELRAERLLDVVTVDVDPTALSFSDVRASAATAIAHIDARRADLVRFVWIEGPPGSTGLLVMVFHHLVIDGVSWQIVLDDLAAADGSVGDETEAEGLPVTFAEWTHDVHDAARAESGRGRTAWEAILEGLPLDDDVLDPGRDVVSASGSVSLELDPSLSSDLGSWVARQLGCGIEDLLLAAYVMALPESSEGPVVIRMEGHGRDERLPDGRDTAQTVGWFTSVYPVRIDVSDVSSAVANPRLAAARAILRTRQGRESPASERSSYALQAYAPRVVGVVNAVARADRLGFNYLGRFGGTTAGAPWSPAAQTPVIIAAPDPHMPLASVLNLDAASVAVDGAETIVATFTYASRHLPQAAAEEIAGRWSEMLALFRDLAADAPQTVTRDLAQHISTREWSSLTRRYGDIDDIWPLAPLQHGLYYHWLRSDGSADTYQMQFVFALEGEVDPSQLAAAVERVVRRLPNLRVVFVDSEGGEPLQVVLAPGEAIVSCSVVDLRTDPASATARLDDLLAEDRRSRFDLETAPPLRFTTYLLGDQKARISLSAHHILLDGWSLPLLLTEILRAYAQGDAYDTGVDTTFEAALRHGLAVSKGPSTAAWEAELAGLDAPLLVPPDHPSTEDGQGLDELSEVVVAVPRSSAVRLAATASRLGVTTSVLVQAAWALTLSLSTGSDDIVFGNTVAVRPSEVDGSDACIGMLTNTIPVRVTIGLGLTLADVALGVREASLRMMDHWHLGLGDILAATHGRQLFDSIVVFESFPIDQSALRDASRTSELDVTGITPFSPTHYPYTLLAAADPVFSATIQYRGGPARRPEAERLADYLATVVDTFVSDSTTRVAEIQHIPSSERERMVHLLNDTDGDHPQATVAQTFADCARNAADQVAVIHGDRSWTYADLDREANRIGNWLIERGVGRGDKVAVAVPRSMTCLAAILGIWHAGAVYVPLDPTLPESRFALIVEDSSPVVVITADVAVDRPWRHLPAERSLAPAVPRDGAYSFFTSGSTGRPQGVLVTHGALANFFAAMQDIVPVGAGDRWLSVTTISFDISLLELFQPLLRGAAVVFADDDDRTDPDTVWDLVRTAGVTTVQATPSLWRTLCTDALAEFDGLRALVGGEALEADLAERLAGRASTVLNLYGPTETTIWSTCAVLPGSRPPSIGRPIRNTQVYVLDRALRPLPVGRAGEVWIAGAGLAVGYFNSPGRTASRFVANPFSARPGVRMYRTGDLARWTVEGEIELLGRNDTQIKLRGFRIELAEVERLLVRHPDVEQALVSLDSKRPGHPRLIAHLVLDDATLDRPRDFAAFLRSEVPEYMHPAVTVVVDSYPLNANGKIDRRSLPEPEEGPEMYVGPSSGLQAALCRLFADALGLERVGVRDEFVALGGHSLIATRLVSRIRTELGVEVPIKTLFAEQTIEQLSARWHELGVARRSAITRSTRS